MVYFNYFSLVKSFKLKGSFEFSNFQMIGALSSSFTLAIYVDILQNVDIANYNLKTMAKNEIISNSSYYYIIPTYFSRACGAGQYYSSTQYN